VLLFHLFGGSTTSSIMNFRRPNPASPESLLTLLTWTAPAQDIRNQLIGLMNGATRFHAQRTSDVPLDQRAARRRRRRRWARQSDG
jgi:hypothetical protein